MGSVAEALMATFTGQPGVAADYLEPGLAPVSAVVVVVVATGFSAGLVSVPAVASATSLGGLATISPGQLAGLATVGT